MAYLGPAGTYSEKRREQFGASTAFVAAPSIGDVFRLVERGEAHYGHRADRELDRGHGRTDARRLVASPLQIVAERDLAIRHALPLSKAASLASR